MAQRCPRVAPPVQKQLARLKRELRREHPELLAVGLGRRRRRGRPVDEVVVKLMVREKWPRGSRPRNVAPLPETVTLRTTAFGQVVDVEVPTDVEAMRPFEPTRFRVGDMKASALARWTSASGRRRFGAVTAAHGLGGAGTTVRVKLRDETVDAFVIVRSSLVRSHVDVGLVMVREPPESLLDITGRAVRTASAEEVLALLGPTSDDGVAISGRTLSHAQDRAIVGEAYWEEFPIPRPDGGAVTLRKAVECSAAQSFFPKGTSGSTWISHEQPESEIALGIQSHSNAQQAFRASVGTHFQTAIEWLAARDGIDDLRVAWTVEALLEEA